MQSDLFSERLRDSGSLWRIVWFLYLVLFASTFEFTISCFWAAAMLACCSQFRLSIASASISMILRTLSWRFFLHLALMYLIWVVWKMSYKWSINAKVLEISSQRQLFQLCYCLPWFFCDMFMSLGENFFFPILNWRPPLFLWYWNLFYPLQLFF